MTSRSRSEAQTTTPFLDAIVEHRRAGRYEFTPPAHRQGAGVDPRVVDVLGVDPFRADLLASGGLDDRTSSNAYLKRAETLMAEAVGAEHAFFSTCGSSLSVKAAMLAVAGHTGDLILPRDVHKAVTAGLVFSGLRPRWITPQWDHEMALSHPPSTESFARAWDRYPDAAAALVVSPSPYGTTADIEGIARVCHARGKPLIVDEAWGAHLPFHDSLPTWAMDAGADVCVVSVHKMGAGFEQGSVFHVQGDLVDAAHLSQCADLLMTTSPSTLVYAALDGWRRQMVEHGAELLGHGLDMAEELRRRIEGIDGLHVLDDDLLAAETTHELDRLQTLVDVRGLGISGYQAADWLRTERGLGTGMSDHRRILATVSMADTPETIGRLADALQGLAGAASDLPPPHVIDLPPLPHLELESARLPREAFFGRAEQVAASRAAGRIAAEQLTPYPPGMPVVLPGERLDESVVDYLRSGLAAGMVLPDATDPSLETLRVAAD